MKHAHKLFMLLALALLSCQPAKDNTVAEPVTVSAATTQVKSGKKPGGPAYGIDISSYQGDEVDFLTKNKDNLTFVICKATEGLGYEDPDFDTNWVMIRKKGFTRGAYHFYHCKDDPLQQAAYFTSVVNAFSQSDLPPIVDFEEAGIDPGCTTAGIQKNLVVFLRALQKSTGRMPIIYTDNNIGNLYLSSPQFAAYPLYIADYTGNSAPVLPGAWKSGRWVMWQKNDTLRIDNTNDDFDMFSGSTDSLIAFIKKH